LLRRKTAPTGLQSRSKKSAELYGRPGNDAAPERHRALARATILGLANSLAADDPLRDTFLSAPSVRRIVDPN